MVLFKIEIGDKMDFFKRKLSLYKEITGLSYTELAKQMDVPIANLFRFLKSEAKSTPDSLVDGFERLLRLVKANLRKHDEQQDYRVSTIWPELFLPRVEDVTYLFSHNRLWQYTYSMKLPHKVGGAWCVESESGGVENMIYYPFSNLFAPYWPIEEHYSLLKNTVLGWEKVNAIPGNPELVTKPLARFHILG